MEASWSVAEMGRAREARKELDLGRASVGEFALPHNSVKAVRLGCEPSGDGRTHPLDQTFLEEANKF
jgi:hypothetical protein